MRVSGCVWLLGLWNVCYLRREQQEDDVYHDVNAVGWFLGNVEVTCVYILIN